MVLIKDAAKSAGAALAARGNQPKTPVPGSTKPREALRVWRLLLRTNPRRKRVVNLSMTGKPSLDLGGESGPPLSL